MVPMTLPALSHAGKTKLYPGKTKHVRLVIYDYVKLCNFAEDFFFRSIIGEADSRHLPQLS